MWGLTEPLTIVDIPMTIIGIIYLVLRIYTNEFKLKKELGSNTRYLSRFLAYYTAIAFIFDFKHVLFNAIVVGAFPMISIVFITHDLKFFFKTYSELRTMLCPSKANWMLFERLSLHIPLITSGGIMYYLGFSRFINLEFGIYPIFFGTVMIVVPLIFFDPRVLKKEDWPIGPIMVISVVIQFMVVWIQLG